MRNTFVFFTLLGLLVSSGLFAQKGIQNSSVQIIPQPQQITVHDGEYALTEKTSLQYDAARPEIGRVADYLRGKLTPATGYVFPLKKKGNIRLVLLADERLGKEGYRLTVDRKGILIEANQPNGLFYGVQSLIQLLPAEIKNAEQQFVRWTVPYVHIEDSPRFAWRGLMLDVSRHFFTKEEVMKYIDELAEYKMNVFHWHLTDDQGWRIEIKAYPRLTEAGAFRAERVGQWWQREKQLPGEAATYGGYYTQEDIKEVLNYASARFVRVIPEIDVPGHSVAALVAYPEMACLKAPESVNVGNKFYGIDENSLCVGNDVVFTFMERVLSEVSALFPDEYIHIGGDECFKGFWSKCPKCKARMEQEHLKDVNELQSYFIRRMEKILKSKNKKLLGWDEIHEGGLAPEATVMSWRGMQGGIVAAQSGHHVVMAPNNHCYLDLYQGEPSAEPDTYSMCRLSDSYRFEPVPEGIDAEWILGGQGNLWAESVPTFRHAEYMTWPRGWAIAEVLWSPKESRDWMGFVSRVEGHFDRADQAEINYARSMYNAIIDPYQTAAKETLIGLSSELDDVDIYYTFDNTTPDRFSAKYGEPLTLPKNATWLRVVTYRGKKMVGQVITLKTDDLVKKAAQNVRK